MRRLYVDLAVLCAGLGFGAAAFSGCVGDCEQTTVPEYHLKSGTFESRHQSDGVTVAHPWASGDRLKTMVVDLNAKQVVVRYFNADSQPVEEVWSIGDAAPYDTFD